MHCMHYALHGLCIACIRHNYTHNLGTTQAYYYQQSTFETRCGPTNIATYRAANAAKNALNLMPCIIRFLSMSIKA